MVIIISVAVGCHPSEGDKRLVGEDKITSGQYTERKLTYKGTDGTPVRVTFTKSDKHDFMTLENPGKRIQLFATDQEEKGKIYRNRNLSARVTQDSIILTQGDQIIEMVKE